PPRPTPTPPPPHPAPPGDTPSHPPPPTPPREAPIPTAPPRTLFASGAGVAAPALAACGAEEEPLAEEGGVTTIRVAATPLPHMEILTFVKDNLAADAGLELDLQEQTEYPIDRKSVV